MLYTANVPLPRFRAFISDGQRFPEPPRKLILLAWLIEGVAVLVSASLAAYPLIAADAATAAIEKWLGGAPFLVIAFAELAKIPIVEAAFRLNGMVLSCIAGFAALLICLNTFYTVSNGFERAHAAKTKDIAAVQREIASIDRETRSITDDRTRLQAQKQDSDKKLADINNREREEVAKQRSICEEYARKGMPCSTRLPEIYQKYAMERKPVLADIESIDVKLNGRNTTKFDSAMQEAKARLDGLIHDNQIYRFAAMVYGYDDPTKMTAKELNIFCFVWFGLIAFAVSTLGPLLAICYYRIKFQAAAGRTAWSRLLQAVWRLILRLARKNKIVKVQEVEKIIEKPSRCRSRWCGKW